MSLDLEGQENVAAQCTARRSEVPFLLVREHFFLWVILRPTWRKFPSFLSWFHCGQMVFVSNAAIYKIGFVGIRVGVLRDARNLILRAES